MTYPEKVALWNEFIKESKIHKGYGQFPALVYVKFGHEPAPLMFWKYWQITLFLGISYAVPWGIAMHFISWRNANMSVLIELFAAGLAGLAFGAIMAAVMKSKLKKFNLTTWDEFIAKRSNRASP